MFSSSSSLSKSWFHVIQLSFSTYLCQTAGFGSGCLCLKKKGDRLSDSESDLRLIIRYKGAVTTFAPVNGKEPLKCCEVKKNSIY